jgi:hypothetical protein
VGGRGQGLGRESGVTSDASPLWVVAYSFSRWQFSRLALSCPRKSHARCHASQKSKFPGRGHAAVHQANRFSFIRPIISARSSVSTTRTQAIPDED